MRKNHLAMKQLFFKIAVHEDRESLWHPLLTQCLNRANTAYISEELAYEDRLPPL